MFKYFRVIHDLLDAIEASEGANMEQASEFIAQSIADGRVLHYFGAGHSHVLGEELFYRAGGLVPVNAILEPALMVGNGASKSSRMEQLPGLASIILRESQVNPGDVMIIASNSGINQVPVEMAAEARKMGVRVIALTSVRSSLQTPTRNTLSKRLLDCADVVIDTHVPYGDAAITVHGIDQQIAPVSTAVGVPVVNSIVVRVVEKLAERGIDPPVFKSANIPGGTEHNAKHLERYRPLIKSL